MLEFAITEKDHCRRLESFMQRLMPEAQQSYIKKLIKSGSCRLDGEKALPDSILCCGASVELKESGAVTGYLSQSSDMNAAPDILWQDERFMAVNKPAGLAMHPAAEVAENLADIVSGWLQQRSDHQCRAYPVNRLDRGTSGVVLLATSSTNAGMLGRQVKEEGLEKIYLAVVEGALEGKGEVDQPLDEKESVTRYSTLSTGSAFSFVMVEPVTGRTHQIRRHLSFIGHPVAGDKRYGATPLPSLTGIALHSFRTMLKHPASGAAITVTAPVPMDMLGLIQEKCGVVYSEVLEILLLLARTGYYPADDIK